MERYGGPLPEAPTPLPQRLPPPPEDGGVVALPEEPRRRPRQKQNHPDHKNGDLGKNRLLQSHMDDQEGATGFEPNLYL